MADIWTGKGERVTEQQHRHQGPMRTANDQHTVQVQVSNFKIGTGIKTWIQIRIQIGPKSWMQIQIQCIWSTILNLT